MQYMYLAEKLVEVVPDLRQRYEEELAWWNKYSGEKPGMHVVYGNVLNPYLISLLEADDNPEALSRIFDFLEELTEHPDVRVQNVVAVTVVERLTDKEEWLTAASPYMGPETRKMAIDMAEFWGTSPEFPFG